MKLVRQCLFYHVTRTYDFLFYCCASSPLKQSFLGFCLVSTLPMASDFGLYVQIIIVFLCHVVYAADISCKNEAGEPVDW